MALSTSTITELYTGKAKARSAELALEGFTLTKNPSTAYQTDVAAAVAAAIDALAPLNAGNTGSTTAAVKSGTKYSGVTVTGTGTFATVTVVNGAITAIALSSS